MAAVEYVNVYTVPKICIWLYGIVFVCCCTCLEFHFVKCMEK